MSTNDVDYALVAPTSQRNPVAVGQRGILIQDLESLWRFANCVSRSGLAPKGMQSPEAIAVAIQMGLEVGLSPMSAMQNIAVINGRPGIFGDAALALVRASGLLEEFDEWFEVNGQRSRSTPRTWPDDAAAVCHSRRRGSREPKVTVFSVSDAKQAKLWGKDGPWTFYPGRMLMFRARGFNLRDNFGDVLKGFRTVEELQDYPDQEPKRVEATEQAPTAPPVGRVNLRNGGKSLPAAVPVVEEPPAAATPTPEPPPPPHAAELPPASEEQPPSEGGLEDLMQDLQDRISQASTVQQLQAVGSDMQKNRDWLGHNYQNILAHYQSRFHQLTPKKQLRKE